MLADIPSGERSADSRVESSSGRTKAHEAMWEKCGIGPGRWAVMDRAGRTQEIPACPSGRATGGNRVRRSQRGGSPWSTPPKCCPPVRRLGVTRVLIQAAVRFAAKNRADFAVPRRPGVERPGHRALRGARHANGRAVPLPASGQTLTPHGRMLRMMKSDRNACTTRIAANAQRARVLNASA